MKVLICAGGTGGHIMPAVAIAHAIQDALPEAGILFVGTDRGMEERIARRECIDFIAIKALGIKGKSFGHGIKAAAVNIRAFITALKIVKAFNPTWVIGCGGYITGMVVLAGYMLGCRCAIQEQNSVAGLTNRLLSHIAHRIFLAFPDTLETFARHKCVLAGNPVRKEIHASVQNTDRKNILILGGSLGASSINRACVEAMKILKDQGIVPEIIHQTGSADFTRVTKAYEDIGLAANVHDFMDDMALAYRNSCMAVCRCGGLTLSELSRTALPAIMIPYPHATDNHQMKNALYVAS
ncbi:MAG: UDP-N-acetylglucosamine--N-acetylmuramyl-(pentapeptide) pyrophosphoryl-undecaprenol N-acetylglucosamine transferase, partial [Deltaproteobacteria bacterium]|nr:UDP-N-acetylglucosamine--N-acetylmuramyl-(pentapeptide) pyrophosphoryl-undecaprenol N-acetylglucosamine transferase [Deltaproteobacteria bacterium]